MENKEKCNFEQEKARGLKKIFQDYSRCGQEDPDYGLQNKPSYQARYHQLISIESMNVQPCYQTRDQMSSKEKADSSLAYSSHG